MTPPNLHGGARCSIVCHKGKKEPIHSILIERKRGENDTNVIRIAKRIIIIIMADVVEGNKAIPVANPLKGPTSGSTSHHHHHAEIMSHTAVPHPQQQQPPQPQQQHHAATSHSVGLSLHPASEEASPERPDAAPVATTTTTNNNAKRPHTTTDKDGNQLSEKKLRRLAKNRVSARECRRRKREATENLQREINVLEGENLRLRLQLQIGQEAEESMEKDQTKLTEEIDALLKSGASEAEIYAALESFKEKYADYGRDRRSAIEFHLRNVERLLMPTQTTSVVMRAIQGGSQHASESSSSTSTTTTTTTTAAPDAMMEARPSRASATDNTTPDMEEATTPNPNLEPKVLFQTLVNRLNVTPEQAAALKDSRFVAKEMDACFEQALGVVKELRERLAQTGEDLETEFNNVRNVLSPTQAAKFLVWVSNNSAAIHMLNELWDRIYPSALSSSSSTVGGDAPDEDQESAEEAE